MLRFRLLFLSLVVLLVTVSVAAQDTVVQSNDKLLAWIGAGIDAANPVGQTELVFINNDGSTQPVLAVPANTPNVTPCGDQAASPSGRQFALYVGGERGTLYVMTDANPQLQTVGDNVAQMTCVGAGTFMFSPNSARFAYLDYEAKYNTEISFTGTLLLKDSPTFATLATFNETAAFDLNDSGAAFVEFIKNDDGEAVEAIVRYWDGTDDRDLTFTEAEPDCYYVNANVRQLPNSRLVVVLGYRCTVGETQTSWQFYTVDVANRSMTLLTSSPSEGRYVPVSRTNAMYPAPDGSRVVFAVPDGFTAYSSALVNANLADSSMSPIVGRNVVMPSVTARPYNTENHLPVVSPDGSLLALVSNDPNNQATLVVVDLANAGVPPIEIPLNDRGEIVAELMFTPDSNTLYYIQGGEANRSLYALDMLSGSENRVSRGRLAQGVLSPEGNKIAMIRRELGGEQQTPYITIIAQDIASGNENVLFTGGEVVDNRVTNQRFAYLLAWRRSV